ncbi:MAG: hypothetical protein A2Z88_04300 [Omnitrophica WOR_2 bacterium GWA2_47_8]|nr:MAG: hypothetical protein A2Z88_04300 [Omnitrophica WOR_2 bacterium GWA2_47_8]
MSDHTHDIQKEVKGYLVVGISLLGLTLITVAVSYLHLNLTGAIIVALCVATIKGSLVACYFMHLISEQRLIYIVLVMTVIFFAGMMGLIVSGQKDHLFGTTMLQTETAPVNGAHH